MTSMLSYDYTSMDYSKPIDRTALDSDIYESKLLIVNEYKQSGNPLLLKQILNDYTSFSYLMLTLDDAPLELYSYQDLILNDPHPFKIFRAARQIGKSTALDAKAAVNLLKDHGHSHNECIISRSLPQAIEQMRRVKMLLNQCNVSWKENVKENNSSVIVVEVTDPNRPDKDGNPLVKYTNMLVCAPCTGGALGYSFHEVNLDEFEYWEEDQRKFYNSVIQPTIIKTNGKVTTFSNPNGADSFTAELESLMLPNGEYKFHTYVFNYYDCPGNDQEKFDMLTVGLSRQELESQYLAIRSLSDRNYFTSDEIFRSYDKKLDAQKDVIMLGRQPFFFLDVGAKHDQSFLCGGYIEPDTHNDKLNHVYIPIMHAYPVGYPLSRVVGIYDEQQETDGWHTEKSVKEYIDEYSIDGISPTFGVDVTGNSGIVPLFNAAGMYPTEVVFSGPSKSGMFQRFKYFMEKGLLHRPKNKAWETQASTLEVKKSARGYLMIHHANENDLDDAMDATAGLIYLADNPTLIEPSIVIV